MRRAAAVRLWFAFRIDLGRSLLPAALGREPGRWLLCRAFGGRSLGQDERRDHAGYSHCEHDHTDLTHFDSAHGPIRSPHEGGAESNNKDADDEGHLLPPRWETTASPPERLISIRGPTHSRTGAAPHRGHRVSFGGFPLPS